MKKLLKTYGFTSNRQYFVMIAESYENGQKEQAIRQFKALPKDQRIEFLCFIANPPLLVWVDGAEIFPTNRFFLMLGCIQSIY